MVELNTKLYLQTAIIRGPRAYHPVTLEAQIIQDNYLEDPHHKKFKNNLKSFPRFFQNNENSFDETPKVQKPKNFNSTLKFMNSTYEKMPWFKEVRYNGEELTERLLNIAIKDSNEKNKRNSNNFLLKKYWVESNEEIYWRLHQKNNPEMTGDTSEYSLIIKVNEEENERLTNFAKNNSLVIADFDLGEKLIVRKETINDHFD